MAPNFKADPPPLSLHTCEALAKLPTKTLDRGAQLALQKAPIRIFFLPANINLDDEENGSVSSA